MKVTGITTSIEKVTPTAAKRMLAHNTRNRTLTSSTVNFYARLMDEDKWELNGDALRFAEDGTLLDGQHRLAAIVKSNKTITILVVRGLPMESQLTMDQQRKRTAGDALSLYDIPSGNHIAAIVRMVDRWDAGERSLTGFTGSQAMLSPSEVLSVVQDNEIYLHAVRRVGTEGISTVCSNRVSGTLFVLAGRVDFERTEDFFHKLATGAELAQNHPVLTLRRYWMNLRIQKKHAPGLFLNAGVRAWNAYAAGRTLATIAYKSGDIPEIYKPRKLVRPTVTV